MGHYLSMAREVIAGADGSAANPTASSVQLAKKWGVTAPELVGDRCTAVGRPIGEILGAGTEPDLFEAAVIRWLNNNPPTDLDPDVCGCCGEPLGRIGPDAVPFLTGAGRHVWLHHGCHGNWMAQRRAEAVQALAGLGLKPPDRKEA